MKSEKKLNIAIALILLLSFSLNLYGISWGLPSFNGWAADELIPARVLEGISQGFSNGWHYKYPPFHYYLLTILYSPILLLARLNILEISSLQTYTILFYIGRFLSVIQGTAIVFFVYLCGREIYEKRAALLAALITVLICPFIYYAKTINLDVPYLFWFVLSLLFYIKLLKSHKIQYYLLFSATAAVAVATKDQAYGFYVSTPFFIIWQHHRYLKQKNPAITLKESLTDKKIIGALAIGLFVFLILHNIVFNFDGFFAHIRLITSGSGKIRPRYEKNIFGHLNMLWQSFRHIRFSFGWPIYIICLIGILHAFTRRNRNYILLSLLVPIVSYYIFYITIILFNDVRYLLPICIIFTFFGGLAIDVFLKTSKKLFGFRVAAVGAIFVYTFAYTFSVNIWMVNDSRYYVEKWMSENIDKSAKILTIGLIKYLPRLDGFNFENTENPSLEELTRIQPDYIIISSGYDRRRFEKNTPESEFFSKLEAGAVGYKQVLQYRFQPKVELLPYEELSARQGRYMRIYSNFDKINPVITIYKKQ
ncbi:MAG: glycosyltransferase family 39 protein [Oscillatoriaceae bacterium SKW80]|nr:glycosyltransferase family 39 protein [Oscillatoriaceae bacterium SKYG93]MCX8121628.1 glycosyltransferase family 39 protein [Oscillatoriaceae bacterium SKW80]MDW8453936.1 glycosyltransferase family 39 protein [Oscillatoriaceae cyanobacterium SKYGB_i_bin93]HIK28819.1 glycosyltransferase family 39 protein [Oscillatoriaceae cyanobacterium M7585_C2015_266]